MRTPQIAGTWYPNDAHILEKLIEDARLPFLPELQHPAVIMLPHAGYAFSGHLAAACASLVNPQKYTKIIILAPSHHYPLYASCSVEPEDQVETPFGPVNFSHELYEALSALPFTGSRPEMHKEEHSIDIQLPILRKLFPHCEFGALLVGSWTGAEHKLHTLAKAFKKIITKDTLLVISTDFTHYGRNFRYLPFTEDIPQNLEKLDHGVFSAFASNNDQVFAGYLAQTKATVCGAAAMRLVLAMLSDDAVFHKVAYTSSGEMTGNWQHCVSYMTAMLMADLKKEKKNAALGKYLVDLARNTISQSLLGKATNELDEPQDFAQELQRNSGAFVTLNKEGALRGCIGEILPRRALKTVVQERALSAAFSDPRFQPVEAGELEKITIEVSVLSAPEAIASPDDIIIGKHGVILQKGRYSAVFLPQVAPEQGWDVPTMLTYLAQKAGLPSNGWKDGCQFFVFTADVFYE